MPSATPTTRPPLCSLLLCLALLNGGCAASSEIAAIQTTALARIAIDGSARAAPSSGARYRVVVGDPGELGVVVVSPDGQMIGRLKIRPLPGARGDRASSIELDPFDGPPVRVEAWSTSAGLRGHAIVGEHSAHFRVRVDPGGRLVGQAWSAKRSSRGPELAQLRRARQLSADLAALTQELQLDPALERELIELSAFTNLALDLTLRAWQRRGRTHLPKLTGPLIPTDR